MAAPAPHPAFPPKLIGLNLVASLLLVVGAARLFVLSTMEPISQIPEAAAWACLILGVVGMVVFWVALLQGLKARRSAG